VETLPNWFWNLYYLFLLTTLGTAIYSLVKNKNKLMSILSILAIVLVVFIPIVSIVNSIGRAPDIDEYEHLVSQLQQGATWSIFTITGYLFLLVWWVIFLFNIKSIIKATISN
jgi:hypothetical protein